MWALFSWAVSKILPIFQFGRQSQVLSTTRDLCTFITQKASTSPTDCSDDSWRDTSFGKHKHSVTSDMRRHRKTLTYLLTFGYNTENVTLRVFCACALHRCGTWKYYGIPITRFYHAMLCIRGTSHGPVSVRVLVCLSVCLSVWNKPVFY